MNSLTTVGGIFSPSNMNALTSMSFNNLTTITGYFNPNNMNAITSMSFNNLTTITGLFNPFNVNNLTSISLDALTTVGGVFNPYFAKVSTINLPNIQVITTTPTAGDIINIIFTNVVGSLRVTTFSFGPSLRQVGVTTGNVNFSACQLNQTSVDNILIRLAALDGTNGTTIFSNRTVSLAGLNSVPSASGTTAKNTLIARGCTVNTN
jgi:hypothetical protein